MFCTNCGDKVNDGIKFCGKCGKIIINKSTNLNSRRTSPPTYERIENSISYLPQIIHEKSNRRLYFGYLLLTVAVIFFIYQINYVAIGLTCWGGFLVFRRITDREDKKHYAYQITSLAGYQNINDLSKDFIRTEKVGIVKIGSYKLNSDFLSREKFFSYEIYPMSQMFWAYKKIIRKSINFIPVGKDYEIVMHFKPDKVVSIKEPEKSTDRHLMLLIHLCPEAEFGYAK